MKRKLLLFLPILTFFYFLESFFVTIRFVYESPSPTSGFEEQLEQDLEIHQTQEIHPEIHFEEGLFFKVSKLSTIFNLLEEKDIPTDGQLEKTIDKLERSLLSTKISVFFWLFIGLLCFSTFLSIWTNAWFAPFTGRVLFFLSFLIGFQNFTLSVPHMIHIPIYGFISFCFHTSFMVMLIWGFRSLGKSTEIEKMNYYNLYVASQNNEESNTGKIFLPIKKSSSLKYSNKFLNWLIDSIPIQIILFFTTNQIVRHFIIIILTGIVMGNIIYIPLFSLQKHYSSQFGFLLFISILLMCIFYIKNYYSFIKEEDSTKPFIGILIGTAFLQFRFLRNVLYFLLSSAGVIFFIVAIFLLLTLNTVILKNFDLIDKTLNL
jgi:hypothetical protein